MSRPVVHVHLAKLASAGLVRSRLDLSEDGKALRVVELESFDIRLTPETVTAEADREASNQEEGHQPMLPVHTLLLLIIVVVVAAVVIRAVVPVQKASRRHQ